MSELQIALQDWQVNFTNDEYTAEQGDVKIKGSSEQEVLDKVLAFERDLARLFLPDAEIDISA